MQGAGGLDGKGRRRRPRRLGLGLALGALVLAVVGTWLWRGEDEVARRARRLVGLVASDGERALRAPLRPHTPGPRVLLLALDGVGVHELQRGMAAAPGGRLRGLLGPPQAGAPGTFVHGYAVPGGALSILPSTTMAAWGAIFTGAAAGRTGVPGNEWFERETGTFRAPAPVSVHSRLDTLRMVQEGLVGDALQVPTLFERADVRAHVGLAPVYRGADLYTAPGADAVADAFFDVAGGVVEGHDAEREAYAALDTGGVDAVLGALEHHGVPRLQVVYFPGVDLWTHVARDALAAQERYVAEVLDAQVGRVLDAYARAGALDDTYVVLVADHGHTPVLGDDRHALSASGHDEPTALLARLGWRVRPLHLELPEDDPHDFQAVVAYQGAFAYVSLADRSTCPAAGQRCDWHRPPRLQEDVLPVARAFHAASARGEGVQALQGTLELVLARAGAPPGQDAPPFQVYDGERLQPVRTFLAAHPAPHLLALAERLEGLAQGPMGARAGDVALLARSGLERPLEERFYFAGHYHSWHGSPGAQDSRVPLVLAHTRRDGAQLRARLQQAAGDAPTQLDVTPLVLSLLKDADDGR